ncbi:MAG: GTP-binding protein [Candidatus Thorarchaeota archaeon]|nr:GTP-binding protein [Candidatus Thorarchaeota archaeon]
MGLMQVVEKDIPMTSSGKSTGTKSLLDRIKRRHRVRKMLIAGSGAVGKTSLLNVLKRGTLEDVKQEYHRTLFLNIDTLKMDDLSDGDVVGVVQVIDVAGQLTQPVHPFRDADRLAFGGVDLIVLVFSSDDLQSLLDIEKWIALIDEGQKQDADKGEVMYVLVQNKVDLPDAFDHELVDLLLKNKPQIQAYFETSCLNGTGIAELRRWIVEHIQKDG